MNALIVNSSIKQTKKNEHGKLLARVSLNKVREIKWREFKAGMSESEYDANFTISKVQTTNGLNFRIINS